MSTSRILVVDDDSTLRETVGEVLRDEGYDVRRAANGVEALAELDGWAADLVILDVMMPVMDAYTFRMMQLARDGERSAPVLVMSAVPDLDGAARRLDAAGVVGKPFRLSLLLDEINRILDRDAA